MRAENQQLCHRAAGPVATRGGGRRRFSLELQILPILGLGCYHCATSICPFGRGPWAQLLRPLASLASSLPPAPSTQRTALYGCIFFVSAWGLVCRRCVLKCGRAGRFTVQYTGDIHRRDANVKETRLRTKNSARYIGSYFALKKTYKKN